MLNQWLTIAIAAFIPLVTGFFWYGPFLFQKQWMAATGVTAADGQKGMFKNMILLYVFSFFIGVGLMPIVLHQLAFYSMLGGPACNQALNDPTSDLHKQVMAIYAQHGHTFRSFRHGALHATIAAITLALPLIAVGAVFEKRSVKYVLITWGFWLVNFILMGAFICHFSALPMLDNLK